MASQAKQVSALFVLSDKRAEIITFGSINVKEIRGKNPCYYRNLLRVQLREFFEKSIFKGGENFPEYELRVFARLTGQGAQLFSQSLKFLPCKFCILRVSKDSLKQGKPVENLFGILLPGIVYNLKELPAKIPQPRGAKRGVSLNPNNPA